MRLWRRFKHWRWKRRLPGVTVAAAPFVEVGMVMELVRTGELVRVDQIAPPVP